MDKRFRGLSKTNKKRSRSMQPPAVEGVLHMPRDLPNQQFRSTLRMVALSAIVQPIYRCTDCSATKYGIQVSDKTLLPAYRDLIDGPINVPCGYAPRQDVDM